MEGRGAGPTALEAALLALVRRCHEAPASLTPADLDPLRALVGDSALGYALVVGAFHYINRMADLLHVDSEFLPQPLLRFPVLRRAGVFFGSHLLARMDLRNRVCPSTYDEACRAMAPVFRRATGRDLAGDLEPLRARPAMVEVLRHALEERDQRSSLTREQVARVHELVDAALPRDRGEAEGFHPRPPGAFEAFVFVGTRHAARTTAAMLDDLRAEGWDDLGLLDLAHAVAEANQWARTRRLLGLSPRILRPGPP